jgi:hypothetical protein
MGNKNRNTLLPQAGNHFAAVAPILTVADISPCGRNIGNKKT